MTAVELRKKYLDFFVSKGHAVIPSASLIPENDPTVLFTTAGMHPLVPFLTGEHHPAGKRLVNYQRCIRTGDIDAVGDDTHLTFFEMLGNWSLGDYFKKEAIQWSWEFLTDKQWLCLDPTRIYVTCFAGDADVPKDDESASIWKTVGVPDDHIAFLGRDDNWWGPAGTSGPCGPDTEMFYQVNATEDEQPTGAGWPKGKYVEIWNDVFMEYNKLTDGSYEKLKQRNVDTGMGVERTLAVLTGKKSVYETELFTPILNSIETKSLSFDGRSARIVADHMKAAVFILGDGVVPSNKEQGYIARRLIRKAIREMARIGLPAGFEKDIASLCIELYESAYPDLGRHADAITNELVKESSKFSKTIGKGMKLLGKEVAEIKRDTSLAPSVAFGLYQTYGFPPELTYDLLVEREALGIPREEFDKKYAQYLEAHQKMSRKGAEHKFKGGLADHSGRVIRMHTATHLLHQALRDVLGDHVFQKGSNITSERLRFDFSHTKKVTSDELQKVEDIVNEKVRAALPVIKKTITLDEAKKLGAIGLFEEKYGEKVSVYLVGDYSKEFCGGPHVKNTKEVGKFAIQKEEAVSAGIRRIKAVVTPE